MESANCTLAPDAASAVLSAQPGGWPPLALPSDPAQPAAPSARWRQLKPSAENHLLQVRLGVASSLFAALRAKHAETAAHALRVTLGCASWAVVLGMSDEQRDVIEVAALLHDIGKIGVPDSILLKPGPLTADEQAIMDRHRLQGVEILHASCACPAILDVVYHASTWFDGSRPDFPVAGAEIPLGARLLSIVDAFDSMTWDQAYRKGMGRERAITELFRHAGTQFDPDLVKIFAAMQECDQAQLHEQAAQRWLESLDPAQVNSLWKLNVDRAEKVESASEGLFPHKLLENMRDAVSFIDASLRVMVWNPGAERMTGISAANIFQHRFVPGLLEMRNEKGALLSDKECLVADAIASGEQRLRRVVIRGRGKADLPVEVHIVPVVSSDGITHGATLMMRDLSGEQSLEARCQNLYELATKDTLTRVANRAEFNRVHATFVAAHLEQKLPCSLIIADLDHFKRVNDTFGHPVGDEVLKRFARLLKQSCRPGDLVARYGGEEFVMLCADCDVATASRRAEEIRKSLAQMPQPDLDGGRVTASFGVTEIQQGDTPETMVSRADRGLYDAKARGRNTVVQLGAGLFGDELDEPTGAAPSRTQVDGLLLERRLVTSVPLSVAVEKLRGFVADHRAEILLNHAGDVRLKMGRGGFFWRRQGDRPLPLGIHLRMVEDKHPPANGAEGWAAVRTRIHVTITALRTRDRRRTAASDRARQVLSSIRAYLMACDDAKANQLVSS